MHKTRLLRDVIVLILVMIFSSVMVASQEKQTKSANSKTVTVTGCLRTGDEAGEYSITGEDGKLYGLRSKTVALGKHVGHKVTVTGVKMREESEQKQESEKQENAPESSDLRVTNLKMISEGCK
jgi:hypothetical protein